MCVCFFLSLCVQCTYDRFLHVSKTFIQYAGELCIFYDREKKEGERNPVGEQRLGPNGSLTGSSVAL